jgi:hypothetical protein
MSSKLVNIGESAPKILSVVPVVPVVPFRAGPSLVNLSSIRLVKRRTIFSSKASNHAKDTEVGNKKEEKKGTQKSRHKFKYHTHSEGSEEGGY